MSECSFCHRHDMLGTLVGLSANYNTYRLYACTSCFVSYYRLNPVDVMNRHLLYQRGKAISMRHHRHKHRHIDGYDSFIDGINRNIAEFNVDFYTHNN